MEVSVPNGLTTQYPTEESYLGSSSNERLDEEDNDEYENTNVTALLGSKEVAPRYYNWKTTFPQLEILLQNIDVLREEALSVNQWTPWPEDHFSEGGSADWTVFPLVHTFPAYEPSNMKWIGSTTAHCPRTTALLKSLPGLRTALFSRLGPQTLLSSHRGWADLANYVLRCHINLLVPDGEQCGLAVEEELYIHRPNDIIVFDDSKYHRAFNRSDEDRVVLIVDIARPTCYPLGTAKGSHTAELDRFIDHFR